MRSLRVGQALAAAGITAAAALVPVATATPAAAASWWVQCSNYVADHGYIVGPKVKAACGNTALHLGLGWAPNPVCLTGLVEIGVKNEIAQAACIRAHRTE
jgi:hypothetical protein